MRRVRLGRPRPDVTRLAIDLDGDGMPEPYRELLVHDQDMTSTLEKHHGESLELCRLETRNSENRRGDGALWRHVLLVGTRSGEIREAGAIRIDLRYFSSAARWEVLQGLKPLGAILAEARAHRRRAARHGSFPGSERTPCS